ncbi:MAG: transglutaminase-like domain-containing protein, partial [Dokdonella sp.]
MPIERISERLTRAALSLGIAMVMWFSHLDMAEAVAAQTYTPTLGEIAARTTRDRDQRVRALAARLESIASDLARIQPIGAVKPSAADVQVGRGDAEPNALASRVLAAVDGLGDFEAEIETDWRAENDEMAANGVVGEIVARHADLLSEVRLRTAAFKALVEPLRDARSRGAIGEVSASLANMSDFFAQHTRARAWAAIEKAALPLSFMRTEDAQAPQEPASTEGLPPSAVGDPPGPGELAETLDAPFSPAIRALADSLGGQPVAIRNWVYDNIEFHPSWGSIQGADATLLSRRGNAFDIASLTLALLRSSGVPARYARSIIEIPIAQAQNWLGNLATPQMAVELMQKGGIPAASVVTGGRIVAVRFEHVWVEAWVDFVPSRAAINRVADQWVPFDVAYKQFDYVASFPWRERTLDARRAIALDFVNGVNIDANGGISGFNFNAVNTAIGQTAQVLADEMIAADPEATTEQFQDRRTIRPIDSLILAGALPYPLRSSSIVRYAELPAAMRQRAEIRFYADEWSLRNESPSAQFSVPLARLGTQRFGIDYAPATAADAQTLAQYAASNAASLPLGQLNVIPRVMLGDEVLWQSNSTRMGVMHYWHVDVRDASGQVTTTEAYQFAAGSTIALVADLVGVTPERVEREGAALADVALLPTRDALY